MDDDPIEKVNRALSETICPGCAFYRKEKPSLLDKIKHIFKPCRYYRPDNFYYDAHSHQFRCSMKETKEDLANEEGTGGETD